MSAVGWHQIQTSQIGCCFHAVSTVAEIPVVIFSGCGRMEKSVRGWNFTLEEIIFHIPPDVDHLSSIILLMFPKFKINCSTWLRSVLVDIMYYFTRSE